MADSITRHFAGLSSRASGRSRSRGPRRPQRVPVGVPAADELNSSRQVRKNFEMFDFGARPVSFLVSYSRCTPGIVIHSVRDQT